MGTGNVTKTAKVVTRFAPSPTGFLHIGGARTALYNWLYAKANGGTFLLRIEDTDKERSTDAAVEAILDGMSWLDLDWEGDPISQASRADRHRDIGAELLASGNAYHCYATPEENQAAREAARAEGKQFLGDLWRDKSPAEAPAGRDPVLRLKMPRDGSFTLHDAVQGDVTVSNSVLDDLVILRADGSPTYMLSVVADDHDMGVTHVIRGDDHLNNTFKQIKIYEAMGWDLPTFAHIPLIHGVDGKKLSKRHGALGVDAYRDMGFVADAVVNYLLRLGWSHGDDELISRSQAIDWFNLDGIGKGAARFDFDKLDSLNALYLRDMAPEAVLEAIKPALIEQLGRPLQSQEEERILAVMPALTERAKRLPDVALGATLFCNMMALPMDGQALQKLKDDAAVHVKAVATALENCSDWTEENIKGTLKTVAENAGVKMGAVMQPVRLALTGGIAFGDLTTLIVVLGEDMALERLNAFYKAYGVEG